jgi:hypothetical protein
MGNAIEDVDFRPRQSQQSVRRVEREEGLRTPHPARVARLLALAHDIEARIEAGEYRDYAEVAEVHGLSRARLTQVMNLLLLAPVIQEEVLFLEVLPGQEVAERVLRRALGSLMWDEQMEVWKGIGRLNSRQHNVNGISG